MSRRGRSQRNDAGSLLATTFIVALGVGGSFFMLVAMSPGVQPTVIISTLMVVALVLLVATRLRLGQKLHQSMSFLSVLGRSHRSDGMACQYEPRRSRRRNQTTASPGVQQPISVDELREIRDTSANTWVPARGRHGSKSA